MGNKPIPELRFRGFEGLWEQNNFGTIFNIVSGYAFKRSDYSSVGTPIINGESIQHNHISTKNLNYLPVGFLEDYQNVVLNTGDIVLGLNRPIINGELKIAQIPKELNNSLLYQRAGKVEILKDFGVDFSYRLLTNEVSKFVLKEAVGSDQPFISTNKLKEWLVYTPKTKAEQVKIGSFHKQIDDKINISQQELTNLKQTKQGFLQKMFPKEGETVPEVRFPGFSGEWQQTMLGDIAVITMGQSPRSENYTKDPKDHILVQGNADIKNGWVLPRVWTTQVTKTASIGDIIIGVRAPVGDVGKTNYDVVIGRGVAAVKGNDFLFQLLSKMKIDSYWTSYSTGSTFESINSTDLREAVIKVPCQEEQTRIGNFFKQLDESIALQEQELEALKQTKQAFLQKMFV